ncbi:MAG: EamA family transporter [Acidobacteria bacterium]|nr:EamA family transporter [Acidobacteriota bacterium]
MQLFTKVARWKLVVAFAAIYLIWGSTYLANRFAIETLPPFVMAGVRFLIAGGLLFGWSMWRNRERLTLAHWRSATIIGALLLLVGNGGVVWSEQFISSGLAALLVATEPLWIVLFEWLQPQGNRPSRGVIFGLLAGLIGMVILIEPSQLASGHGIHLGGILAVTAATIAWAIGSLYSRKADLPASPTLATAMTMLTGGGLLLLTGTLTGEWRQVHLDQISTKSLISVGYLISFGSVVAFSTYTWLLRVCAPGQVATYAYVNPVVAVALGWALAGEIITGRTLIASAVILAGVAFITLFQNNPTPIGKTNIENEPSRSEPSLGFYGLVEDH